MKFNLSFYFYLPCTFHHLPTAPDIYHILSILKCCVDIKSMYFFSFLSFFSWILVSNHHRAFVCDTVSGNQEDTVRLLVILFSPKVIFFGRQYKPTATELAYIGTSIAMVYHREKTMRCEPWNWQLRKLEKDVSILGSRCWKSWQTLYVI